MQPTSSLASKSSQEKPTIQAEVTDREISITLGDRIYKIRGLQKNLSYDQLKAFLGRNDFVHVDTFDLYQSRPRQISLIKLHKS